MKLVLHSPAKSLNKAFLKQSLKRDQIETFKANLLTMFERLKPGESEEHLKNIVADFLKDTWYKPAYEINTSGRADLVIHNGRSSNHSVGVIIEVKRPDNVAQMISPDRPNAKALHELLLYYLTERYLNDNKEVKRLIVCNIQGWYIFDAADFERFFFDHPKLVKGFREWKEGLFGLDRTEWFYREIASPLIEKELTELPCTFFDLREYVKAARRLEGNEDRKLIALYKILSPPHLLKLPFANDSNALNKEFYNELLHLLGLEEVKAKGKKLIRRRPLEARDDGSLLENTVNILKVRHKLALVENPEQYGTSEEEQLFSIALELCITWLNRILFLKLLEGQLIAYHQGDRSLTFLNARRVRDFDELEELFFEVLAIRTDERTESVRAKFGAVPYLNSALFEESDLERTVLHITALKDRLELPLYPSTVLKDGNGRRRTGSLNTLRYLFEFLDAYDFASEGGADIQESSKTLINASVLGLIFEKINGYKDGSFFTPGFITMYICRETIRRAVVRKFNDRYGWACRDITELYNRIEPGRLKEANEVIDSLKVCDPAVGSGHFLVSALNEIIAVKSDLGILLDGEGKRLREYGVSVENDELIVTCEDHIFEYNPKDSESRRVQEVFFHEKATIIENCLFGVDINPKSVAICRLRLWIELLKHAYYTKGSDYTELETLPNIDINIKCGNSLVSRFSMAGNANVYATERHKLKALADRYREKVWQYKLAPSNKEILRKEITDLKEELQAFAIPTDRDLQSLRKKEEEFFQLAFAFDRKDVEQKEKLSREIDALKKRLEEKQRTLYFNAFEWRFEFPEALDENGEFAGFDVVIGNPPYIRIQDLKEGSPLEVSFQKEKYQTASKGNYDIYVVFVERGLSLLSKGGTLGYILPHKFFNSKYGEPLRQAIADGRHLSEVIHFGQHQVFDEATTYTCLLFLDQQKTEEFRFVSVEDLVEWRRGNFSITQERTSPTISLTSEEWTFTVGSGAALLERLLLASCTLEKVATRIFQGLKTSSDKIYIVEARERKDGKVLVFSPEKQTDYWLEEDLLHPLVKGGDSRPYCLVRTNRLILFPYQAGDDGRGALIPEAFLRERFPLIWTYLLDNRDYLENRENGKMRHAGWYGYGRVQALGVMPLPKIFTPDLAPEPRFSLDETGECFFTGGAAGGYGILLHEGHDQRYILGLLNSKLLGWFISQTATQMRGGWYSYESRFIKHLPIHHLDPSNTGDLHRQNLIVSFVDQILIAKKTDPQANTSAIERRIDALVYELYGLTEEEIAVVEGRQ